MDNRRRKIAVIGGGASGMTAAVAAADAGADVTLLEAGERVGKKILATGNGKCNLSNKNLSAEAYYGGDPAWIQAALERFSVEDTVDFFRSLGLMVKDKNGYLYPFAEQASAVTDILRFALETRKIKVLTSRRIHRLTVGQDGKIAVSGDSFREDFDGVILACGGKAAPKTGSDGGGYLLAKQLGHRIVPVVPGLVQLRCREDYWKAVAGVRCEGRVSLRQNGRITAAEQGEIQFTDYGISGIPVFQLSRIVNYGLTKQREAAVELDLLPGISEDELERLISEREQLREGRSVEQYFTGILNKKLMLLFVKLAGLKPSQPAETADGEALRQVFWLCKNWRVHVTADNGFENAQVCAGGVDTAQITGRMASALVPGVYFAGELIDVDGRCGGYNLQWAWTSGYIAGKAAAEGVRE